MSAKSYRNVPDISRKQRNCKRTRVNWHEAASCAIQIELRDYSDLLEYIEEYVFGKNHYRIDLLVIKKLTDQVNQTGDKNQYSCLDVSLSFLSCYYPRKLMQHLREERKLSVEKISPGVYHINKETFNTQIIVTKELPAEDNLYLHFLTDRVWSGALAEQLADDYKEHQEQDIYRRYLHQITNADRKKKGEASMYICEGLLNLCGTSSEEIIERTKKEDAEYYQPRIDSLSSQIDYLKSLLLQHNIPFNLEIEDDSK